MDITGGVAIRSGRIFINKIKGLLKTNKAFVFAVLTVLAVILLSDGSMCIFRRTTGIPCPTCGMTRATLSLIHLDLHGAFTYHPMIFIVIPALMTGSILVLTGKTTIKKCTPWIISLAVAIFVVYIIRMIMFFPDTEPMVFDENSLAGFLIRLFAPH